MILAERGQYLCTTCGSPIAEYREFKKPDELGEVGNAKPIEPQLDIAQEALNEVQQQSDEQYHSFDDFGKTLKNPVILHLMQFLACQSLMKSQTNWNSQAGRCRF
ncbi:MAG: hypothetical protein CM1200mP23_4230 [Nitrososphaerota archaeon]|nr:MAG: hypothetical protein CM1200mP23_4230 [Nitrososphaerota archaeon]